MMRPRRKLPDLPHSLGRIKGSASHTGNIPMGDSQAHIMAPNYSQLRSGSNTAPSTPPTSVLQASTSVTGHKYLEWNFNNSNNGSIGTPSPKLNQNLIPFTKCDRKIRSTIFLCKINICDLKICI